VLREARRDWSDLPGEDLATSALPEVAGWISIYEEMAAVLRPVIRRANGSVRPEDPQRNLVWAEGRLRSWRARDADLPRLPTDPAPQPLT